MAFCGNCGSTIQEGYTFCPNCGATVAPPQPHPPYAAQPPHEGQPYGQQSYGTPPPPPYGSPPPYGAPQYGAYPPPPIAGGLQENVAGLLCYLAGWVTGIIFLLIDKRPFVRFHAAQSIVYFGGLTVLNIAVSVLFTMFAFHFWILAAICHMIIGVLGIVGWIALMLLAYQGKTPEIPLVGGIARSLTGSVRI